MISKADYSRLMTIHTTLARLRLSLFASALLLSFSACTTSSGPSPTAESTTSSSSPVLAGQESDPASADPVPFDLVDPPVISELSFTVEGANLNAIVYEAQGAGPHPTVVLLHGFPGNERNLDLAQAIRRAGWNVVFFHYRGAFGSGGEFSFLHVIEDVHAVVAAIAEPEFAKAHRVDPTRLALIGHSMGGFAALVAGAELPEIDCVASLSGANLGGLGRGLGDDPERAAGFAEMFDGWSGPIKGRGGRILVEEIIDNAERFDTQSHATDLAQKKLLLVAGKRDVITPLALHHDPLIEALRDVDVKSLETFVFEQADHGYSGQRIGLARLVTGWLLSDCDASD